MEPCARGRRWKFVAGVRVPREAEQSHRGQQVPHQKMAVKGFLRDMATLLVTFCLTWSYLLIFFFYWMSKTGVRSALDVVNESYMRHDDNFP